MSKRVLITGATGFVGRHTVRALLSSGFDVLAVVRATPNVGLPAGVELLICTDWSEAGLKLALRGQSIDTIINLAAYGVVPSARDAAEMARVNAILPQALVGLAAANHAALISVGSCAEYQALPGRQRTSESAPLEYGKLYGASKAAGGLLAAARAAQQKVPFAHLRLFNVFGPGEAGHRLLPVLAERLLAGKRVPLSEGSQMRDFISVDDVVSAILHVREWLVHNPGSAPQLWNVATGEGRSVRSVAEQACALLGASPDLLGFGDVPMRPDEIPYLVGDPTVMANGCGWRATSNFDRSLALTVESLRNR